MIHESLVSIIIPTYNRAHLIGETLDSVIAQTYKKWECIVVDDGSTDYTDELMEFYLKADSRIQYLLRPASRPKGANACRNYGYEKSKGSYINWFDSDDIFHSEKLTVQIKSLKHSSHNFSVCQTLVFNENSKKKMKLRHPSIYSDNTLEDYISIQIVWLTQAPLWRRSFLERMDYLFDEELQAAQEWEFHCRCLFKSPFYHFTDKALVYIRKHSQSISYEDDNKKELHYYLARKKVFNFLIYHRYYSKFLSNYFINFYRRYLIRGNYIIAFSILRKMLLLNKRIKLQYRTKLLLAYFSYLITGRGEILFKGRDFN